MAFTRRWKGQSKKDVSAAMAQLSNKKAAKQTKAQRIAHAHMMVAARGSWEVVDGKRVFIHTYAK